MNRFVGTWTLTRFALRRDRVLLRWEIVAVFAYPDHHAYEEVDLERMRALAAARGANLATTEKDFVRLPPRLRRGILTLPVEARFEDERALDALLLDNLARWRAGQPLQHLSC